MTIQPQNNSLNYLVDPTFTNVNRLFVFSFTRDNAGDNRDSFLTKKWYVIDSESKGVYSHENPTRFLTRSLKSCLCNYSDGYVLVTRNVAVVRANNNTKNAFKNCAPFRKSKTGINETFIDEAQDINIAIPT